MIDNTSKDPVLLMCSPDFYEISGPDPETGKYANKFAEVSHKEFKKDPQAFVDRAKKQWGAYKSTLTTLGVSVMELEPKKGQGDLVFTADPTLSLVTQDALNADPRVITMTSRFSNTERQVEVEHNVRFVEGFDPARGIASAHFNTEGTGDNYYDPFRDVYWSGYTDNPSRANASAGRSDIRAHKGLEAVTGVPVVSMAVEEPFFHIDTCMTPLTNGHVIAYKDGMKPEAFETLMREGFERYDMNPDEYLILVDMEDAKQYACNLRCVGNTLIMPQVSEGLQDCLKSKGYEVVCLDMSVFINDGGAMHCLTNNLNEQRVKGGTCVQKGYERKLII